MKLFRRNRSRPEAGSSGMPRQPGARDGGGGNGTRRRPDPQAEPIPDGEHKYVPRSPYRTGNY